MIDIKNTKTLICGIQGSGKTELGKHLVQECFKKSCWYFLNLDDLKKMKNKRVLKVRAIKRDFNELNRLCAKIIELGKKKQIQCFVIDEADILIPKTVEKLQQYPFMHDIFVNHRHYNLCIIFMTRRPQDLNPLVVESCEHKFIYALETSDNILRKMKSIDSNLPDLMRTLKKDNHDFIYKKLGEPPILMKPIKLKEKP